MCLPRLSLSKPAIIRQSSETLGDGKARARELYVVLYDMAHRVLVRHRPRRLYGLGHVDDGTVDGYPLSPGWSTWHMPSPASRNLAPHLSPQTACSMFGHPPMPASKAVLHSPFPIAHPLRFPPPVESYRMLTGRRGAKEDAAHRVGHPPACATACLAASHVLHGYIQGQTGT